MSSRTSLPEAPERPQMPSQFDEQDTSTESKLALVQSYLEQFEYNYSGKPFVKLKRNGDSKHVAMSAKELIRMSLPIQCVEAVFISSWLTRELFDVDRVPLSFKSVFRENVHRHIVLAVRCNDRWGSLGMSRRNNLMNKDLIHDSLSALIREFELSYEKCFHKLVTVYVGLPMPRKFESSRPIKWRAVKFRVHLGSFSWIDDIIEEYCKNMNTMSDDFYEVTMLSKHPQPPVNRTIKSNVDTGSSLISTI